MNEVMLHGHGGIEATQRKWDTDLYGAFVAYLDNSPKTIMTYSKGIRQFITWAKVNGITDPTREDLIRYRDELKATGHKPTTIQNYITALRIFFEWIHLQTGRPNIAEHLKGAKLDREHKKDPLTPEQVKRILTGMERESARGKRDYALLLLLITCGLRTIEVARAKVEDMRTLANFTALYIQGKGREEKTEYVKLPEATERAIRDYLTATDNTDPEAPLFISISNRNTGEGMTTRSISRIIKNTLIEAGLNSERLTAHSMRHTAVTLALLAGQDPREVQEFARHANINTTLIYAHDLDKAKNNCSNAILNMIA